MEAMSRSSLKFALGGLVACAIGGFWLGLQGALPREGASPTSATSQPTMEPEVNAYRTPVDAAPYAEGPPPSDELPASDASDAPAPEPVKKPPPPPSTETRPAPPRETTPAPSATPAPPPPREAPPPPTPTADPEEDLPPF